MSHGSTQPPNIDIRLEATIGIRLASTLAGQDGLPLTAETVLSLAVARVAILDAEGDLIEASAPVRRDLGQPCLPAALTARTKEAASPALLAPVVQSEILLEWQAIAAAARQGSRALMAYQILGGHRRRLLFIPLAGRGDARSGPVTSENVAAGAAQSGGSVAIVACHTLHADGELLDAELEYTNCNYATLGDVECLTIRELDGLRMLGMGLKSARIACALHCSPRQVGAVLKNLRRKLGASDNFKLAVLAIRSGLIDIDDEQWQRTVFLRSV